MKHSTLLTVITVVLLLVACSQGCLLHQYQTIAPEGWERNDTLSFSLMPVPQSGNYTVNLGIRYNPQFPYEAIYVVAETHLRHPFTFRRDTICLHTTDPQGKSIGQGTTILCSTQPITMLKLRRGQQGTIRLHHIMAREILPSIREVGVKISDESQTN